MLLRRIAVAVITQNRGAELTASEAKIRGGQNGKGGKLSLRLRPSEIQAIRVLAEPEGYSAQAWIVRQLRHRLEAAVPFAKDELDVLRDAIRELGSVGRNLNTMLHVLHRSGHFEDGRLDLQALHERVDQLRRAVTATVTHAAHRGHRGND